MCVCLCTRTPTSWRSVGGGEWKPSGGPGPRAGHPYIGMPSKAEKI